MMVEIKKWHVDPLKDFLREQGWQICGKHELLRRQVLKARKHAANGSTRWFFIEESPDADCDYYITPKFCHRLASDFLVKNALGK